jgi:hypothetical protein
MMLLRPDAKRLPIWQDNRLAIPHRYLRRYDAKPLNRAVPSAACGLRIAAFRRQCFRFAAPSCRFRRAFAASIPARGLVPRSFALSPLSAALYPRSSDGFRRSAHRYKPSSFGFLRSRANLRRTRTTSQRARAICTRTRATCIRTPATCPRTRTKCPRLWADCPRPFGFCPRAIEFCAREARAASQLDATTGPRQAARFRCCQR